MCNKCYGVAVGYSEWQFKRFEKGGTCGLCCSNSWKQSTHSRGNTYICGSCSVGAVHSGCKDAYNHIEISSALCDGAFRTLMLLPMNTRRIDVFDMVNEKIRLLGPGNKISRVAFYRLWREEFTHVKIPPYSRFSKCHICWEYRNCIESITNERIKENRSSTVPTTLDTTGRGTARLLAGQERRHHEFG